MSVNHHLIMAKTPKFKISTETEISLSFTVIKAIEIERLLDSWTDLAY